MTNFVKFAVMPKAQTVCQKKSPEKIKRIFLIVLRGTESWKIRWFEKKKI